MAWGWVNTSVRGTSHVRTGLRCQDASICGALAGDTVLSVIVSDGAGSASYGGQGSALICRTISQLARTHFAQASDLPSDDDIWSWVDECRDRITLAATRRDTTARQFSATLVGAFITPTSVLIYHVGDGAVALRADGQWIVPSWPESGEYASTTYFVTDEPSPRLRITRLEIVVDGVAAFTDGIERLALNFAEQRPHTPFFTGIIQPIDVLQQVGRNAALAAKLAVYLDSPAVNERTDDDKTLVLAGRR